MNNELIKLVRELLDGIKTTKVGDIYHLPVHRNWISKIEQLLNKEEQRQEDKSRPLNESYTLLWKHLNKIEQWHSLKEWKGLAKTYLNGFGIQAGVTAAKEEQPKEIDVTRPLKLQDGYEYKFGVKSNNALKGFFRTDYEWRYIEHSLDGVDKEKNPGLRLIYDEPVKKKLTGFVSIYCPDGYVEFGRVYKTYKEAYQHKLTRGFITTIDLSQYNIEY